MDGRISMYMYVLLVCVWCSLDAGGLLMVVTAEPTVSAVILTPKADCKEGGQVDIRCTATNIESHHIVAWASEDPDRVLRLGGVTVTTESRFMFSTQADTTTGKTVQYFTIINVKREDSNEYFCKVNYGTTDGTYNVVSSSRVKLSVLYFPNASFPICFPAGPITVDNGRVLNMRCTSESGHRAVEITFNSTTHTSRYTSWTSQVLDEHDTLIRTSDLTADVADDCIAFKCIIKSTHFPDMERCCTIGPITITPFTAEPTSTRTPCMTYMCSFPSAEMEHPTVLESITISTSNPQPSETPYAPFNGTPMLASSSSAVIAGAVIGGVVALLLIVSLIFTCRKRRLGNSDPKAVQSYRDTNQTNTELSLNRHDNFQIGLNEYRELGTLQEGLQNNNLHSSTQHYSVDASGTMPVQRAQATDQSLIYAKPLPKQTYTAAHEATGQQPDQSFDSTNEQRYFNPAFVSNVSDIKTRPSRDGFPTSLKPMAKVKPTQFSQSKPPRKPKHYQPNSTQRKSNPLSQHDNQMVLSQTPPASITIHQDAGPSAQEEAHPAPNNPTYAQVSPPRRQQSGYDNPDHIVYADLDLQSDEIQDGGLPSNSSSDAVMYASVMRS